MEIALVVAIALLLFLTIFSAVYVLLAKKPDVTRRVWSRKEETSGGSPGTIQKLRTWAEKVLKPLGEAIPRPADDLSEQERRLIQAGIRRKDARTLFYGSQVLSALALLAIFGLTGFLAWHPLLALLVCFLLGIGIPEVWLRARVAKRQENIQNGLPDALDLMVVCVEAGLGLDQTILRISQEIHVAYPDFSDELRLYNLEVKAGRTRVDALRSLALRGGVEDLRSLVAVLIQTDRFGTSIAQSLRVFSESMRVKRRQRAEERAAKMAVKMTVPMVFFVFPSMFIVLLGPGVIHIIRTLFPAITK